MNDTSDKEKAAAPVQAQSKSGGWTRRRVIKSCLACLGSASAGSITGAPYILAGEALELRYISTGVNAFPQISEKALRDLGIKIV